MKLTKQDVFNIAYNHYKNGGKPGYNENNNTCYYFAPNGGNCAIGTVLKHLSFTKIAGSRYNSTTIDELFEHQPDLAKHFHDETLTTDNNELNFLQRLQNAHDESRLTPNQLLNNLENFAKHENLTIP